MKNLGKKFEDNFRSSIDKNSNNILLFRFRDTASSYYGGNENLRFSQKNPCDSFIFYNNKLIFIELKNTKQKSLPFSNIKDNQIKELTYFSYKNDVLCYLIVNFSELEECYAIDIRLFNEYSASSDRKSLPVDYMRSNCLKIDNYKLKTNYRYNVIKFLDELLDKEV